MRYFLPLIALIFFTGAAQAQALDCSDPQNQQSMNQCAYQAWQAADDNLNLAYGKAMATAKNIDQYIEPDEVPSATLLRDAQRFWIPFRDKACEVQSNMARGGTMQPLLLYGCMERLTRQRTEQLREFGEVN